jgi:hypothetical protein
VIIRTGLVAAFICSLAACSDSAASGPSSTDTTNKLACDLITPGVLSVAHFNYRVVKRTASSGAGKNGGSSCSYGDDRDSSHLSSNFLLLLVMTPASLAAQHTNAEHEAKATAFPCTGKAIRELGPASCRRRVKTDPRAASEF